MYYSKTLCFSRYFSSTSYTGIVISTQVLRRQPTNPTDFVSWVSFFRFKLNNLITTQLLTAQYKQITHGSVLLQVGASEHRGLKGMTDLLGKVSCCNDEVDVSSFDPISVLPGTKPRNCNKFYVKVTWFCKLKCGVLFGR